MTLLGDLIDGASGDDPVTSLLRRVKVVAARAEVPALDSWVEHELDGYPADAELPEYRGPFAVEVLGNFSGYFGAALRNAPIPSIAFAKEYRGGQLFNIAFVQPIAQLEELARPQGDEGLQAAWPANSVAMVNMMMKRGELLLYEDMGLQQAWQVISRGQLVSIVDAVRNRILDLALTIEKTHPETGQAGAPPLPAEQMQHIVTHIYGDSTNVAVASTGFSQALNVEVGDKDALAQFLLSLGIPPREIDDLHAAIEEDGEVTGALGPATTGWLGSLMAKATQLGIGAAGGVIADAISRFLGIG